jgi:hypothetical protein
MKENKLIAEFMGVDELKFDTDWNCLMPVVEKCYNTKESYNLHKDIEDAFIYKFDDRLEAVYLAVVSFVKSYNEAMGQEAVYSIRNNN